MSLPQPLTTVQGDQVFILKPEWPAPSFVKALFTSRQGGVSAAPWNSWNLGEFVGDLPEHVQANRQQLQQSIDAISTYPGQAQPIYLKQVHGCDTAALNATALAAQAQGRPITLADAALATEPGVACTIMVGDCLPVLFAHKRAPVVAAAHAGWRGLAGENGVGVLESSFAQFKQAVKKWYLQQSQLLTDAELVQESLVWIGPCIGPNAFEVGEMVRQAFMPVENPDEHATATSITAAEVQACFLPHPEQRPDHWMANLSGLARLRLQHMGLRHLYGNDGSANWCTVTQSDWYFSHRRDAQVLGSTGRMAACIWLDLPG